jgi:energy-coupling factor transporter ATP-binding protein EcfA2
MPFYTVAYGLRLRSSTELPGLVSAAEDEPIDVDITLGTLAELDKPHSTVTWYKSPERDSANEPLVTINFLPKTRSYHLKFLDGTQFIVNNAGTRIAGMWPDHMYLEDCVTNLTGPVLGFTLRLRGRSCLHASCVLINGEAIAIAGHQGAGKSTTAGMLNELGCPAITDDILVTTVSPRGCEVTPGYPQLRLWPDSTKGIFGSIDALPQLTPDWDKRALNLDTRNLADCHTRYPLRAVFFLQPRQAISEPEILRLSQKDTLLNLLANAYASRLLTDKMKATDLKVFSEIARQVAGYKLTPQNQITDLRRLCDSLLETVTATIS